MSSPSKKGKKGQAEVRNEMNVKVLLQNRTADFTNETPCTPEMILMNSSDMRALRVKAGACVALTPSDSENLMVFQCWPSSKLLGGCVSLNRVWWPNFDSRLENRSASLSRSIGNLCVLPCKKIFLSIMAKEGGEDWINGELQQNMQALTDYVYGYIGGSGGSEGVCATKGLRLGLTWKTRAIALEVLDLGFEEDDNSNTNEMDGTGSLEQCCYRINAGTTIRLFMSGTRTDEVGGANDSVVLYPHSQLDITTNAALNTNTNTNKNTNSPNSNRPISLCDKLYLEGFAGYEAEARLCMRTARLGLGLSALSTVAASSSSSGSSSSVKEVGETENNNENQDQDQDLSLSSLSQMILKAPRGVLLHGPSGCGKTRMARAVTDVLHEETVGGVNVMELSPSLLLSTGSGDRDSAIATLTETFREAQRCAPSIILLDDCELLCQQRSNGPRGEQGDTQRRVLTCLLNLLDGIPTASTKAGGVFIIACSNRPDLIDSAMRRPGRLDVEVEVRVPSAEQRAQILGCVLERMGLVLGGSRSGKKDEDEVEEEEEEKEEEEVKEETRERGDKGKGCKSNNKSKSKSGKLHWKSVRDAAKKAHGMVGGDLLKVAKEAHLCVLDRDFGAFNGFNGNGFGNEFNGFRSQHSDSVSSALSEEKRKEEDSDNDNDNGLVAALGSLTLQPQPLAPSQAQTQTQAEEIMNSVSAADLLTAIKAVAPMALKDVATSEIPSVYWSDIGGMAPVKQCLKEVVEWPLQYPQLFQRLGVSPPQGVLLYGPPGCSKTLMAKALATESGMNFLAVRGPELMSKWLGESEKAIQTLFKRARSVSPCIVFFDEIDALASRRGEGGSGVNDRVLAQLLTELDGIGSQRAIPVPRTSGVGVEELVKKAVSGGKKETAVAEEVEGHVTLDAILYSRVIVVAATNRPDMLDPALMRPGRIDRKVYVPPPDEGSRTQILLLELAKLPVQGNINIGIGIGKGKGIDVNNVNNGVDNKGNAGNTGNVGAGTDIDIQDIDIPHLVNGTSGFSGAEVVSVCQEAAMLAMDEGKLAVSMGHLDRAMRETKPQITEDMLNYYEGLSF